MLLGDYLRSCFCDNSIMLSHTPTVCASYCRTVGGSDARDTSKLCHVVVIGAAGSSLNWDTLFGWCLD